MPKLTKAQESRLRGLTTTLEFQTVDVVAQVEQIRYAWVRKRMVEGRYHTVGGEVREPVDTYDLWLEDAPGEPPRDPDAREPSAHAAAKRLLVYEDWVRFA